MKNPVEKIASNPVTSVAVMVFSALAAAPAPASTLVSEPPIVPLG